MKCTCGKCRTCYHREYRRRRNGQITPTPNRICKNGHEITEENTILVSGLCRCLLCYRAKFPIVEPKPKPGRPITNTCPNGHAYTGEEPFGDGHKCRICNRERWRRYRAKKTEAENGNME